MLKYLIRYSIVLVGIVSGLILIETPGYADFGIILISLSVFYSIYTLYVDIIKPAKEFENIIKHVLRSYEFSFFKKMPEVKKLLVNSIIDKDISLTIEKIWLKEGEKYNLIFGKYCNSGDHINYGWFFLVVSRELLTLNFRCHKINDKITKYDLDEDDMEKIFLIKEGSKSELLKLFNETGEDGLILREFSFQIVNNLLLLDLQNFRKWKEMNYSTISYFIEKIIGLSNKLVKNHSYEQH